MSKLTRALICGFALAAIAASGCQTPPRGSAPPTSSSSQPAAPSPAAPASAVTSPSPVSASPSASASPPLVRSPHRRVVHARGHGVIRSIDSDRGGVTIEHEANDSLNVEAGVTHYRVRDKQVLTDMESGVEVDYDIDLAPDGTLVVSDLVEMGR